MWYTKLKGNRPVESGPIEWDEFKEAFLGNYFPRERREAKVQEFINLKEGNISVEKYSLKFLMWSIYGLSLLSNLRDEMHRFLMGVDDLVSKEWCTTMLHDNLTLDRLTVYA